jgi:hypothetical protein
MRRIARHNFSGNLHESHPGAPAIKRSSVNRRNHLFARLGARGGRQVRKYRLANND